MRTILATTVAALALTLGAALAADDAKKIAQDVTNKWVAAYNAGDAKGVAALYTEDAPFSNAGAKDFMKGQNAIEQNIAAGIKQGWKISVVLQESSNGAERNVDCCRRIYPFLLAPDRQKAKSYPGTTAPQM